MNALSHSFHVTGHDASSAELLALAQGFRTAAARTRPGRGHDGRMLREPFALLCLHAIELAMDAALRSSDFDRPTIRAMGHNLSTRARALETRGLIWRRSTLHTIDAISRERLSLIRRTTPPEGDRIASSRVEATADETFEKCAAFVARREDAMAGAV